MKLHLALCGAALFCLGPASPPVYATDFTPSQRPLDLAVNFPGRPAGAVECHVTAGPAVPVVALAFSPDGKTLAVAGYQEVVLWDLAAATLARRIAAGGAVGTLAFLKDGQTLVVGQGQPGRSGALRFVDLASGKDLFRCDAFKDVVSLLALSPDGKLLIAGGSSNTVGVWSVEQKKLLSTLSGHTDRVLHAAFSADGKLLATAAADNTAQVWNTADWTPAFRFTEAQNVRGAAFHPDAVQLLLAVGGNEASGLRFRRTDNPTYRRPIGIGAALPLGLVGPAKNGRVYVPCSDKIIRVFDIRNGSQVATLAGHQDWVYAAALSPDETRLASGSGDGAVKLWSTQDGRLLATLVQLAPRADQWLILTAQGYFNASSPAGLDWKAEKLPAVSQELTSRLQNPQTVGRALAGEKVPPPLERPPAKPAPRPAAKVKAKTKPSR